MSLLAKAVALLPGNREGSRTVGFVVDSIVPMFDLDVVESLKIEALEESGPNDEIYLTPYTFSDEDGRTMGLAVQRGPQGYFLIFKAQGPGILKDRQVKAIKADLEEASEEMEHVEYIDVDAKDTHTEISVLVGY